MNRKCVEAALRHIKLAMDELEMASEEDEDRMLEAAYAKLERAYDAARAAKESQESDVSVGFSSDALARLFLASLPEGIKRDSELSTRRRVEYTGPRHEEFSRLAGEYKRSAS